MDNLDFLAEFSHLGPVSSSVGEVLHELKGCMQHPDSGMFFEVEARLGSVSEQGFVSNVGKECFTALLEALESYPNWHQVSNWVESQDVFYITEFPNNLEGKTTRAEVRTTVGLDYDKKMVLKHCIKRRLRNLDFKVIAMGAANESTFLASVPETLNGPLNPRVSFSVEQTVPDEVLPIAVVPTKVRIKQRKRFFITSLGVERPAFSVDMTIVYTGKSKSEAEQSQVKGEDASYEVEVECLEPLAYLQSCNHQEDMLALSLLLKLHDFVSFLNPNVPITFVKAK
jgi:hypothetical protein